MKCPFCGHLGDKVVDSRESREGDVIRRRRECLECARRFTSYERVDEIPYMVVKKDGRSERFERQKLIAGLLFAQNGTVRTLGRDPAPRPPSLLVDLFVLAEDAQAPSMRARDYV